MALNGSDWVTGAAFGAMTLQLLRLAIDLIQVASQKTTEQKEKDKDKTTHSDKQETLLSEVKPSNYGSVESDNNKNNEETKDPEEQPLLDRRQDEAASSTPGRVYLFLAFWMILAVIVLLAIIFKQSIFFSVPLLVCTFIGILLEALLLLRDKERERYGILQRFLHLCCMLGFWIIYAVVALQVNQTMSLPNIFVISAVTLMVVISVLDGWLAKKHPTRARRQSLIDAEEKATLDRKAFLALLKPYFWPDAGTDKTAFWNRLRAIATWICVSSSKACSLFSPLLLGWASTALAHQDYAATIRYSILYSIISLLAGILKEGQSLVYLKVKQAAFVQLSSKAFGHLHSLSLDWHLRKKLGEVLRSMTRGIDACNTLMTYLFLWLLPALAECVIVCVIFATYFQYLPLALAVFYFVFTYIVWTILVTLWRKKFRKQLVQSDNEWNDRFTDSLVNFETVKFFTAEDYERERFQDAVSRYQSGAVNVQASLSLLNVSQQVILKACLATGLSLTAWGIKQRIDCCVESVGCESGISECCRNVSAATCPGMEVGDFVAVLTYTLNLFAPLNFLGSVYNAVVMALIDLTNLSELLAESPDVTNADDAFEFPQRNLTDPDTVVEFDNVHFHYPSQSENKGLKGMSFKMKRGTTTAIVGPTGAGKTTVSRLLFRFYDVLGGAVKVNGADVRSVTQKSLRGAIGVVPQSASMFNDTIRTNLLYGRRDATQQELEQAARDAQLLEFIESLDEGWDTMVGDRGLKLSGGEKQRAAIARCLLKDPPIVLLDEATSALDTITESSVQHALDRLGEDRTVLVIAHRLGTIRNAHNIIVLKDGTVAEEGTHDQLLARNGVYADMWNMQLHSVSASNSRTNLSSVNDI